MSGSEPGKDALSPSGLDEPSPEQLAGVLCAVAGTAERQNWTVEHASEVLDMLGMGPVEISLARRALRASLRAQLAAAQVVTPVPALRSVTALVAPPDSVRDARGLFVRTGLCQKLLHPLQGDNVVTRPDRKTQQCRACTVARKQVERARKRAAKLSGTR